MPRKPAPAYEPTLTPAERIDALARRVEALETENRLTREAWGRDRKRLRKVMRRVAELEKGKDAT